jgi:predicted metalloendopeptidase
VSYAYETVETVTVSATRKIQLDQYEPVSAHVSEEHRVPDSISNENEFQEWRAERQDDVMAAAEQAAMRRHEEYVREEAFGDE